MKIYYIIWVSNHINWLPFKLFICFIAKLLGLRKDHLNLTLLFCQRFSCGTKCNIVKMLTIWHLAYWFQISLIYLCFVLSWKIKIKSRETNLGQSAIPSYIVGMCIAHLKQQDSRQAWPWTPQSEVQGPCLVSGDMDLGRWTDHSPLLYL